MSDNVDHAAGQRDADRRVQRTRAALVSAFNQLVLSQGYDAIGAADVARVANVGRSTFYEHFRGKADILGQAVDAILTPLADACREGGDEARLLVSIEHFWHNRRLARALMAGQARALLVRRLAGLIESRMAAAAVQGRSGDGVLPGALSAAALAHGQLALIDAWLSGRQAVAAAVIARALSAGSQAAASAMREG